MAVDLTGVKAGDTVLQRYEGYRNAPWREVTVAKVGRKYLYVKGLYKGTDSTAYSRVDGWSTGRDRVITRELLDQETHEKNLNEMIKAARLSELTYSGWTLAEKERLYSLLKEMGKVL